MDVGRLAARLDVGRDVIAQSPPAPTQHLSVILDSVLGRNGQDGLGRARVFYNSSYYSFCYYYYVIIDPLRRGSIGDIGPQISGSID